MSSAVHSNHGQRNRGALENFSWLIMPRPPMFFSRHTNSHFIFNFPPESLTAQRKVCSGFRIAFTVHFGKHQWREVLKWQITCEVVTNLTSPHLPTTIKKYYCAIGSLHTFFSIRCWKLIVQRRCMDRGISKYHRGSVCGPWGIHEGHHDQCLEKRMGGR